MRAGGEKLVDRVDVPLAASAALPRLTPPSKNLTVPVGAPVVALTVAVNVTCCRAFAGLGEAASAVVLARPLITSVRLPVLPANVPPAPYAAVMVWLPADNELVL